jgi:hypothetical protein
MAAIDDENDVIMNSDEEKGKVGKKRTKEEHDKDK